MTPAADAADANCNDATTARRLTTLDEYKTAGGNEIVGKCQRIISLIRKSAKMLRTNFPSSKELGRDVAIGVASIFFGGGGLVKC